READVVGARRVRRKIAAAVRAADLEARKAVERALEDEVRKRERGLERVADGVLEAAVALEAALQLRGADRMDEHQHAELLGLLPERVELRIRELLPFDAAADAGAAQAELLHGVLELLRGEIGMLQRHRGERDESVGLLGDDLGELVVLQLDQLGGDV